MTYKYEIISYYAINQKIKYLPRTLLRFVMVLEKVGFLGMVLIALRYKPQVTDQRDVED
jgi:hypothetical protein